MRWIVFVAIYLLQISLTFEKFWKRCPEMDWKRMVVYFTHHLLDVFLFWGFAFLTLQGEYIAHIFAVFIVLVHWIYNNNKCIATEYLNELCGWDRDRWLDSLKNMMGLRYVFGEYFHFLWLGIIVVWDAWKLIG